jgi:DNA-binding NarL/FixJ family response regulator
VVVQGVVLSAVVADELPLVRAGVAGVLRARGVTIAAETHSGRDLLPLVEQLRPNVVVVGALAGSDELDSVTRVAAPHPAPLVIVLLAAGAEPRLAGLLAAGADGITRRNGSLAEVDDVVGRVLDGDRVVADSLTMRLPGAFADVDLGSVDGDGSPLSARERELLVFLAQGRSNKEIAGELSLSLATVKSHLVRMYAKLEVGSRAQALAVAVSRGLLT